MAAVLVAVALAFGHLAPLAKRRLVAAMQTQLGGPVHAGNVTTRFDGGWRGSLLVDIDGLDAPSVLRGVAGDPAHPMLRVRHATFRTSLLAALLGDNHVHDAYVQGIVLTLPPAPLSANTASAPSNLHLDRLTADDVHLTFATGDPSRAPLVFDLPHVVLTRSGKGDPMQFAAVVDAGDPVGLIQTTGTLGPWQTDSRTTPLQGSFSFAGRNVKSVQGLHGILSMKARFQGTLTQLETVGTTEDPAFGFDVSGRPVLLRTNFSMAIDANHGIITLRSLEAHFLRTHFQVAGTVLKSPAAPGYVLDLALRVPDGRMEDALVLAAPTQPTLLRGALTLQGHLHMPAGPESVSRKLQMTEGRFHLSAAQFGNNAAQREADGMSERAEGRPQDATTSKAESTSAQASGTVTLENAMLHFSAVQVTAPGVHLSLGGGYALGGSEFAVNGTIHTDARASETQTGLKSLFTRPFNGMLAHGRGGATLPLSITGSGNLPQFKVTLPGGKQMKAPGLQR